LQSLPYLGVHEFSASWRRPGVKVIRFHDAGHTHVSIMLKQGIHPKIVQERLGHSSIAITLDTYSHVTAGLATKPLAWSLALGTDIGGNGTPIGASANVVGTAIAEKEGYKIGWGRYCKYALPAMIMVVGLCNLYLVLRYA
jgi:di/tricarboxylate transporter